MDVLQFAMEAMKKKKSADKVNVVFEMLWYSRVNERNSLLHMLNDVLRTGIIPINWYGTHFSLLHKSGFIEDAND